MYGESPTENDNGISSVKNQAIEWYISTAISTAFQSQKGPKKTLPVAQPTFKGSTGRIFGYLS